MVSPDLGVELAPCVDMKLVALRTDLDVHIKVGVGGIVPDFAGALGKTGFGRQNAPNDAHHLHLLPDLVLGQERALVQMHNQVVGKGLWAQPDALSSAGKVIQDVQNGGLVSVPGEERLAAYGDVHRAHLVMLLLARQKFLLLWCWGRDKIIASTSCCSSGAGSDPPRFFCVHSTCFANILKARESFLHATRSLSCASAPINSSEAGAVPTDHRLRFELAQRARHPDREGRSSTMRNSTPGIASPDEPGLRRCGVLPITM